MKIVALVAAGVLAAAACSAAAPRPACSTGPTYRAAETELAIVTAAESCEHGFKIELAKTPEQRTLGLMYRESLAEDAGMLFDFGPEPRYVSMWMKNTLIPLDMAFIDENGVIVSIAEMTTPQSLASIGSGGDVVAVLEVAGGRLGALGVAPGDKVRHPWFD